MSSENLNFILFFVALLLSAGFSSSEAAFLSIQRGKLAALQKTDSAKAQRISRFSSQPEKLLATVLTGNNLANTAAAALGTSITLTYLDGAAAVIVSTLVVTLILLVFAEAIPKTFAARYSLGYASTAAIPLRIVEAILLPPIWLLERFVRGLTAIMGLPDAHIVSREELQALIQMGAETGDVEQSQAEILDQVFRMQDRRLSDVMTYRTDIVGLPDGTTVAKFLELYSKNPHDRYPVYRGTIDEIVGVLPARAVLAGLASGSISSNDSVTDLARRPRFLPETKLMGDVFRQLPQLGAELIILIDEYGGVAGVVSIRQMIEELVGHFDEMDTPEESDFDVLEEGGFVLRGDVQTIEANESMKLEIPNGPYETVAGFFLSQSGALPEAGSNFIHAGHQYEIQKMDGLRIAAVVVTPVEEATLQPDGSEI